MATRLSGLALLRAAPRRAGAGARRLGRAARAQQHGTTSMPPAARWCASWARAAGCGTRSAAANTAAWRSIDTRAICLIRETLARHNGLADFAFAMQGLGSGAISLFGSEAPARATTCRAWRAARRLPRLRCPSRGRFRRRGHAVRGDVLDGDHYVLNGEKTWISNGGIADFYVVFARTGEAPGARGISAFIVDAGTPGFEIAERIDVIAPHPLARLRFTGCRVGAGQRLGEAGQGFKVAMATLDVFRTSVAAAALGFARRALDEALAAPPSRKMFGQTLADFQLTQAKLAADGDGIDAARC
jgi:acyl-CoA dehydrogenase